MRNLHRLMGSRFTRYKPLLCPTCRFFRQHAGWYGVCAAKGTLLSNPLNETPKRNSCADYERGGTGVERAERRGK